MGLGAGREDGEGGGGVVGTLSDARENNPCHAVGYVIFDECQPISRDRCYVTLSIIDWLSSVDMKPVKHHMRLILLCHL